MFLRPSPTFTDAVLLSGSCTGCVINLPEDWEPEDFADKPLLEQPEKPFPVPF